MHARKAHIPQKWIEVIIPSLSYHHVFAAMCLLHKHPSALRTQPCVSPPQVPNMCASACSGCIGTRRRTQTACDTWRIKVTALQNVLWHSLLTPARQVRSEFARRTCARVLSHANAAACSSMPPCGNLVRTPAPARWSFVNASSVLHLVGAGGRCSHLLRATYVR